MSRCFVHSRHEYLFKLTRNIQNYKLTNRRKLILPRVHTVNRFLIDSSILGKQNMSVLQLDILDFVVLGLWLGPKMAVLN